MPPFEGPPASEQGPKILTPDENERPPMSNYGNNDELPTDEELAEANKTDWKKIAENVPSLFEDDAKGNKKK